MAKYEIGDHDSMHAQIDGRVGEHTYDEPVYVGEHLYVGEGLLDTLGGLLGGAGAGGGGGGLGNLGNMFGTLLRPIASILEPVLGIAENVARPVLGMAEGALGNAGNLAGGVLGSAGDLASGLLGSAGNLASGLGGTFKDGQSRRDHDDGYVEGFHAACAEVGAIVPPGGAQATRLRQTNTLFNHAVTGARTAKTAAQRAVAAARMAANRARQTRPVRAFHSPTAVHGVGAAAPAGRPNTTQAKAAAQAATIAAKNARAHAATAAQHLRTLTAQARALMPHRAVRPTPGPSKAVHGYVGAITAEQLLHTVQIAQQAVAKEAANLATMPPGASMAGKTGPGSDSDRAQQALAAAQSALNGYLSSVTGAAQQAAQDAQATQQLADQANQAAQDAASAEQGLSDSLSSLDQTQSGGGYDASQDGSGYDSGYDASQDGSGYDSSQDDGYDPSQDAGYDPSMVSGYGGSRRRRAHGVNGPFTPSEHSMLQAHHQHRGRARSPFTDAERAILSRR